MNLLGLLSQLTHIGCDVAIVAVIASVVKRHRPDAHGSLLAWAVGSLVASVVFAVTYGMLPTLMQTFGMSLSSLSAVYGLISLVHAAIDVALVLVLIKGLVAIAQPPKQPVIPSAGTYR